MLNASFLLLRRSVQCSAGDGGAVARRRVKRGVSKCTTGERSRANKFSARPTVADTHRRRRLINAVAYRLAIELACERRQVSDGRRQPATSAGRTTGHRVQWEVGGRVNGAPFIRRLYCTTKYFTAPTTIVLPNAYPEFLPTVSRR